MEGSPRWGAGRSFRCGAGRRLGQKLEDVGRFFGFRSVRASGSRVLVWSLLLVAAMQAETADVDIHPGESECPALFGTALEHDLNERSRLRRLSLLQAGPEYIDVVQTGGWERPKPVGVAGIELLGTGRSEDGEPVAVFRVHEELGLCEAGEYEVEVDAALGEGARVLGILPNLVLLEVDGALAYMRAAGSKGRPPLFKVSWQSKFAMPAKAPTRTGRARARARRSRSRRR